VEVGRSRGVRNRRRHGTPGGNGGSGDRQRVQGGNGGGRRLRGRRSARRRGWSVPVTLRPAQDLGPPCCRWRRQLRWRLHPGDLDDRRGEPHRYSALSTDLVGGAPHRIRRSRKARTGVSRPLAVGPKDGRGDGLILTLGPDHRGPGHLPRFVGHHRRGLSGFALEDLADESAHDGLAGTIAIDRAVVGNRLPVVHDGSRCRRPTMRRHCSAHPLGRPRSTSERALRVSRHLVQVQPSTGSAGLERVNTV
jgi:hypothetical protein